MYSMCNLFILFLCRLYVFGSATAGRRVSALLCLWTRSLKTITMSRVLLRWICPLLQFPANFKAMLLLATLEPIRLYTCLLSTNQTSSSRPCTLGWSVTWLNKYAFVVTASPSTLKLKTFTHDSVLRQADHPDPRPWAGCWFSPFSFLRWGSFKDFIAL